MTDAGVPQSMPHNLEAEQALLGCLMYDVTAWAAVEGRVSGIQFYEPFHGRLFVAIEEMLRNGRVADPVTLAGRFTADKAFNDLGGRAYLGDLVDRAPPAFTAGDYARVIAEADMRRQLIRTGERLIEAARVSDDEPESILVHAENVLGEIARGSNVEDHWIDGEELCREADMILNGEGRPTYLSTGIAAYDAEVGGFQQGRYNILAAAAKMGKTTVGLCVGLKQAQMGRGVGMFSLEMDKGELAMRAACALAYERGADDNPMYFLAAKGELSVAAARKYALGARALRDLPIKIDERAGLKMSQIAPAAKRLIRSWEKKGIPPGIIIIDHLTIVAPEYVMGANNKVQEVSATSGAIRDLARQTGVTFLVLCQLSREVAKRGVTDKRPQLSDLRWSGEIEQDAAQVTFLYRPEYYLVEPNKSEEGYLDKVTEYEVQKDLWKDKVLLLNRANRLGPSNLDIEHGLSIGCNAMWDLAA
jgi:replicative DNA helicase